MIYDLDRTIEKLLIERGKINKDEVDIVFDQPTSEWSSHLSRPTVNCWVYDLRENVKLRSMETRVNRSEGKASIQLAPLRYNVSYLITAWARRIEDEHTLIWRALEALSLTTSWDPEECEGVLREQPYALPVTAAQMSEGGANLTDLWSVLDNDMRLGFTLVVTLALDTERGIVAPLVFEKRIGIGQSDEPLTKVMTALDLELTQKVEPPSLDGDSTPKSKSKEGKK